MARIKTMIFDVFRNGTMLYFTVLITLLITIPNFASAQKKQVDSLDNLIKKHPFDDDTKATLLFSQSANFVYSDPKKSLDYVNQILSFQQKIKQQNIVSSTYRLKGIVQYYLSSYNDALLSLGTALRMDRQMKIDFGIASDLSTIGMVHMARSNYYEALRYYQQALTIFETIPGHQSDVSVLYANIGVINIELHNYEKALGIFHKAITVYRKFNNKTAEAAALTNIGVVYGKQNNYESAVLYSEMSRKLSDSIGDKNAFARETGNLAGYYSKLGQYNLSLTYGLKAIELNKEISNKKSIGYNQQNVAEAYLKKGDHKKAKSYGLSSLKTGQELKILELQRDASEGLSRVYESLKMPDSAFYYYKQYTVLGDSITNDKKLQEITRLGMQYDFDKKETIYKQSQRLSAEQLKQQKLQLALNEADLQRGLQLRNLQQVQLQNEKLSTREKQKQLIIQAAKVKSLSQEQKLNKLELSQLWLYGILAVVILVSILFYLINLYRIRQLRFKNTLENQQAKQNELNLTYQYQLSESELKAIRSQMNPHFIFNVLNSIESFIMDNDKRTASRLIQKFASLSRLILENSTKSLITADKEWKALMLYTELEAMRYNNLFAYEFTIEDDLQLKTLLLPPMLIQPLIENAILHGLVSSKKAGARLTVDLKKSETGVCIIVTDNGTGLTDTPNTAHLNTNKEKSMGLESIRERIQIINLQHPGKGSFTIRNSENSEGVTAQLCLPLFKNEGERR